jgi:hypothetical protein
MALNKTAGETKVKEGSVQKTTAPVKKAAPKKAAPAPAPVAVAAPQKAAIAPKAAVTKPAPVKLTVPQHELLKKVAAHTDPAGYHTDKKTELKVFESLLKHKLVKTGKKHPETKQFHHFVSTAGKKHLESGATPKS